MPKKPTTLLEHASKYVKKFFESVKPLHVETVTITPTNHELIFNVRMTGHLKHKAQKVGWSLLFTIQNDRLIDIVYIAPRFENVREIDFSLTSGRARDNAVVTFHTGKGRVVDKRHEADAKQFQNMFRLCAIHSQRVHEGIGLMARAVAAK